MQPKRPTQNEKILLKNNGHDSRCFLKLDEDPESYTFLDFISGKELVIWKQKKQKGGTNCE